MGQKKEAWYDRIVKRLKDAEERLPETQREGFLRVRERVGVFVEALSNVERFLPDGLALLPPPVKRDAQGKPLMDEQGRPIVDKEKIILLIHYDDQDDEERKQAWYEERIHHARKLASETDENIQPLVVFTRQIWQELMDGRYDISQQVSMGLILHDARGILTALKVTEVHKNMVLRRFERYIVSYVLAGSLTQGRATEKSDIDVFIVVDDTDVKRMTRFELMEKLRAIIYGMGIEAGDLTGVQNKLNIQVYILTDFWQYVQEANPIIFTFLRDGVPLYDRGLFMPWKLLLKQGRLKPSPEAIDAYMASGRQMITRAKYKLKEIGLEDVYWAVMTPTQAALMLYGLPPPTPREAVQLVKDIFVKREKFLTETQAKLLEDAVSLRKALEHGDRKEFSGKEADEYVKRAEAYLEKIEKVFEKIQKKRAKESLSVLIEDIQQAVSQLARVLNVSMKKPEKILTQAVEAGVLPPSVRDAYERLMKAVTAYEEGKLTLREGEKARSEAAVLHRQLIEATQYARLKQQDAFRIRLQGKRGQYDAYLFKQTLFLFTPERIERAVWNEEKKSYEGWEDVHVDVFEEAVARAVPGTVMLTEAQFESIKQHLKEDTLALIIERVS